MTDVVIVGADSPPEIVIIDGTETVIDIPQTDSVAVVEVPTDPIIIVESPIQGPPGIQGPIGPIGPAGPAIPAWSYDGPLAVYTGTHRLYTFKDGILSAARATVATPSTGADIVIDVVKNDTTVVTTLTIPAGANSTGITLNAPLAADDYLTVSIVQVGSVTPGSDLVVQGEIV